MFRSAASPAWALVAVVALVSLTPGCFLDRSGSRTGECGGVVCLPGQLCVANVCVSDGVDGGSDGGADGGLDGGADGGADAGPDDDAGFDAGVEVDGGFDAGFDAGGTDAGPVLDPRTIPGMTVWLRGESLSAGDPVSVWADESGSTRTAVAVDAPPLAVDMSGRRVVRFDGTGHLVFDPVRTGQDLTVFVVARVDSGGDDAARIVHSDDYLRHWMIARRAGTDIALWTNGRRSSSVVTMDAFHVFELFSDATTLELTVDGSAVGSLTENLTNAVRAIGIGGNPVTRPGLSRLTGDIGEILIWNRGLDATERAMVNDYLSTRWGALL